MDYKGTYKLPMRKASQVPTSKGVSWKLTPSSPDRGGAYLSGYSTVSDALSSRHCRRRRCNEKHLAPACLDMLIFKSTDPNVDVTYTLLRFDVHGWLDQYQEESMMPHIYASLQGYLGRWVHSLEEGRNITISELLVHMDCTFGDVHDYDTMIRSLYEIRQKESESVEEYLLQIHEAVAVICHAYPDWISDQGKKLMQDRFYHGLLPSLCDALGFAMAELPKREQVNMSFDTLYTLAKKIEAHQPSRPPRRGSGSSKGNRNKYRRYPTPTGRVATLEDEELFLSDPEAWDVEPAKVDQIEGLSVRMTQAMNHYQ